MIHTGGKIFITGCAKTGTTLVRRLFNAFDLKVYNREEITLSDLLSSDYDCGKRWYDTVFSSDLLAPGQAERQICDIKSHRVRVVNVTRDRAAVLASSDGYVKPERYDACVQQVDEFGDAISVTIRYEDLLVGPDTEQVRVADALGLSIVKKWSEYPTFVELSDEADWAKDGRYTLRPIA